LLTFRISVRQTDQLTQMIQKVMTGGDSKITGTKTIVWFHGHTT